MVPKTDCAVGAGSEGATADGMVAVLTGNNVLTGEVDPELPAELVVLVVPDDGNVEEEVPEVEAEVVVLEGVVLAAEALLEVLLRLGIGREMMGPPAVRSR